MRRPASSKAKAYDSEPSLTGADRALILLDLGQNLLACHGGILERVRKSVKRLSDKTHDKTKSGSALLSPSKADTL